MRSVARGLLPVVAILLPAIGGVPSVMGSKGRPPGVAGATSSSCVTVGATVVPYVRLESIRQEDEVTVTSEEITRGYVEVRPGARLSVRTNSIDGYLVNFQLEPGIVLRAEVLGLAQEASLEPGGGRVLRVPLGIPRESLDLGFRFHLSPQAKPGVYRWPVTISLSPPEHGRAGR